MAVTKADLADTLFQQLGLNKREAKEFVELFFEHVREALETGQRTSPHSHSGARPSMSSSYVWRRSGAKRALCWSPELIHEISRKPRRSLRKT